jgi:hypothetical protein
MFDKSQDLSLHLVYLQKLPVGGDQGLDEQETQEALAVHTRTRAG